MSAAVGERYTLVFRIGARSASGAVSLRSMSEGRLNVGEQKVWMVRAGSGARYVDEFRSQGMVAIAWNEAGDASPSTPAADIDASFAKAFPERKPGWRSICAGQVKRFIGELKEGDSVCTYDPNRRVYLVGSVGASLDWHPEHELGRQRAVKWNGQVYRDTLSVKTRNTLGAISTLFRLNPEASAELLLNVVSFDAQAPAVPEPTKAVVPEDLDTGLRDDVIERAAQFTEDRIAALGWSELQDLVAAILRAMGYKTRVASAGPDRGVDIFASPDGLGLQEPRIFVEVKHRKNTAMGAPELRSFLGGRSPGDKLLYVSSGGFTKEARYEAERSSIPLTLVNLPQLREMLVDHYENLDAESRGLVPLTKVYWPA